MANGARRPAGVTVAAILAILGAALLALLALLTAAVAFRPRPTPAPLAPGSLRAITVAMDLVWLGFSAWGIATAVGLFRMRNWSRRSVLTFSGLLIFFGGLAALNVAMVPLPPAPRVSPGFTTHMRIVIAVFYAVLALIGVFWLIYFNRPGVRAAFGSGAVVTQPDGRPLSVTIIAWVLVVFGVLIIPISLFIPFPGMLFGVLLKGLAGRLVYPAFGVIEVVLGIGLLRLNPLSRVFAIAFFALAILNAAMSAALPAQSIREMLAAMPVAAQLPDAGRMIAFMRVSILPAVLVNAIPIWFLVTRRRFFTSQPSALG
jgi:hypothetical protein